MKANEYGDVVFSLVYGFLTVLPPAVVVVTEAVFGDWGWGVVGWGWGVVGWGSGMCFRPSRFRTQSYALRLFTTLMSVRLVRSPCH